MKSKSTSAASFARLCKSVSNWGRWGADDQLGTLNFLTPERIRAGADSVHHGKVFSLAIPLDETGPQGGGRTSPASRFNPIHLMIRDGADALAGTLVRDFYGGNDREARATDDVVIMALQSGTHWDALSHMIHEGKMYNGFDASWVSSWGALRNDIATAREKLVGRGVLLDIARFRKCEWLASGEAIDGDELRACANAEGVSVKPGDIVLVRTGRLAQARAEGSWSNYNQMTGAPGLGLRAVPWLHESQIAAVAADTTAVEVLPCETPNIFVPVHIACLVYMGLPLGEVFDLEALAQDCAADGIYEFMFVAPPLPFTRAVGSPINPVAVK